MADTITTWTPISAPTDFRDDAVFDIDSKTKSIQVLVEQPIVAGENKSQFIKFQMGRYYDAIDLTAMQVNIVFLSPAGNRGISAAVNTEYSEEAIRFGWLVPYEACPVKGKLYFAVEFVGADYTLKTTAGCTNVLDSISDRDIVPEPVEQEWYIVLQANVATLMQEAQRALGKVEGIFNALGTPMTAGTAAEMVEESAIYVYTGSEPNYEYGYWYYHDGTGWMPGSEYASTALTVDTTLSVAGRAADAKAVGDALASMGVPKGLETIIQTIESVNLYDSTACNPQNNKVYNVSYGTISNSENYAITGKIPVEPNTQYIFSTGGIAKVRHVAYYKGETGETFISYETLDNAPFTTPDDCTFVGLNLFARSHTEEEFNSAIAVSQLEEGDTATDYSPYGERTIYSPYATASDVGKIAKIKAVANGRVIDWEYADSTDFDVDAVPTESSNNPVSSGGVYSALAEKQNTLVFDSTPTENSTNPVTSGGVYSAIENRGGGETTEELDKLAPVIKSKNLYDATACNPQNGYWYHMTTGVLEQADTYAVSGKIPVEPNTEYIFSTNGIAKEKYVICFGGENGETFLKRLTTDNASFTTEPNTTFIGVNLFARSHTAEEFNSAIAVAQLEKGSVATDFVPYSETRKVPTSSLVDADAVEGAVNYTEKCSLINLYDKSLAVDGTYFNTSSHTFIRGNVNKGYTGFIPVKPNTQYNISCDKTLPIGELASYYQEWTADKTFIQNTQQPVALRHIGQIQTTENTAYITMGFNFGQAHTTEQFNALIDTVMLCEGMMRPLEYSPYNNEPTINHAKIDIMRQLNADRFRGKKWLVTGTSVSYQDSKVYTEGVAEGELVRGYIGNVSRCKPMLIRNEGISGSTLADTTQDTALINRYQNLNMGSYDFITVEYGINDFGRNVPVGTAEDTAGTDTFAACLKTIIEYVLAQNPIVGLIICTEPDVRGTTVNQNGNTLKDYADVTLAIAKQYRLPVCDWFYHSGINHLTRGDGSSRYYFTQAGTHPSVYGHMRMGAMLNQVFDSLLC